MKLKNVVGAAAISMAMSAFAANTFYDLRHPSKEGQGAEVTPNTTHTPKAPERISENSPSELDKNIIETLLKIFYKKDRNNQFLLDSSNTTKVKLYLINTFLQKYFPENQLNPNDIGILPADETSSESVLSDNLNIKCTVRVNNGQKNALINWETGVVIISDLNDDLLGNKLEGTKSKVVNGFNNATTKRNIQTPTPLASPKQITEEEQTETQEDPHIIRLRGGRIITIGTKDVTGLSDEELREESSSYAVIAQISRDLPAETSRLAHERSEAISEEIAKRRAQRERDFSRE